MIVIDASVLVNALTDDGPIGDRSRTELAGDPHWAAPEHLLVEVFSAVRGRRLGGRITEQRAADALDALSEAAIDLMSVKPLLARMWQRRGHVNGYDAAYLAAAEAARCPLLTADVRLAGTAHVACQIRVV